MTTIFFIFTSLIAVSYVSAKSASVCGINEQLGNCGRICEKTCNDLDFSSCAATTCHGNGCQCKEGYLRNEATDSCVPASMCPPKTCQRNETLGACGTRCEGSCKSPSTPEICSRILCARAECRCDTKAGYVRNSITGECIASVDCPEESKLFEHRKSFSTRIFDLL